MRTASLLLLAACVTAGCLPVRGKAVRSDLQPLPPPVMPAETQRKPTTPQHIACIENPLIDTWERRLRGNPGLRADTRRSLARGQQYLPRVRQIIVEAGLPSTLALLPVVESGYRHDARGSAGDVGLWQFRRPTARQFGLIVNREKDQRLHPYHATRAAARYLRALHRRYGDWPLALAAYNAGERRIDRGLAAQPGMDFWELAEAGYVPRSTRNHVARFLAVARIVDGGRMCARASNGPARTDDDTVALLER
jgi:hypothetical protein